jgi:L-erythro-3,5-diaminohexanoate dehydrogenase
MSATGIAVSLHERVGAHRVVAPRGALPQVAEILDASPQRRSDGELLIDVDTLNVDSASFRQLELAGDVAAQIRDIVARRGKLQNPVTGSGGMLLGRVSSTGDELGERFGVAPGDRVATLVSLTLTPLSLDEIVAVRPAVHQVDVRGTAVLFPTGALAKVPADVPERVALALFDVAGAAPQVARLAAPGAAVCVLGAGGKSGLLCAAAAREVAGPDGVIVGVEQHAGAAAAARAVGACDEVIEADAAAPLDVASRALAALGDAGDGFDLVVSCVNTAGAEPAAILLARERGCVYFFGMATSFSAAALGAEGLSRDVDLMIGNGYCADHAELTLALYRRHAALRRELDARYG